MSANKNAVYLWKDDCKKDSIDKKLLHSMTNSKQVYVADKEKSEKEMDKRRKRLGAQKHDAACKRKVKKIATKLGKKACLEHNKRGDRGWVLSLSLFAFICAVVFWCLMSCLFFK